MTREEIIRNLKYTMKKHENDRVDTFGTNISLMCKDILDYLEQEPCEDTISREMVVGYLCTHCPDDTECFEDCDDIKNIKAFPSVTKIESCEDCISRQYLLDNCVVDKVTMPYVPVSKIEDAPPVTLQQKYGKWIGHREHCEILGVMPSGLGAYEWCSNCDCGIDVREWHRNNYNFCPNCGAKMQESEKV